MCSRYFLDADGNVIAYTFNVPVHDRIRKRFRAWEDSGASGLTVSGDDRAIRFMAELGVDLTTHDSKSLDEIDGLFDAVITMGCGDSCPWVPARIREDWALPDPKHMADEDYRAVRDTISAKVRDLLERL